MHKYETPLTRFRFDSIVREGYYRVTWYVLEPDDTGEEDGRCFNDAELKQFQDYATQNPANFEGRKDYWACTDEDITPSCSYYDMEELTFPENVILRKAPELLSGSISNVWILY